MCIFSATYATFSPSAEYFVFYFIFIYTIIFNLIYHFTLSLAVASIVALYLFSLYTIQLLNFSPSLSQRDGQNLLVPMGTVLPLFLTFNRGSKSEVVVQMSW